LTAQNPAPVAREAVVVRFAGDSGDGIQLTGSQFTKTTALFGNDIATLPDYPAEIRAPAGTEAGVSGYQIQFGATRILTPGDASDVLVAFNPAALKASVERLRPGGMILVDEETFTPRNLTKAGYLDSPLDDNSLLSYQVVPVSMTKVTREALKASPLSKKDKDRARNFFALGMVYYLFDRPLDFTISWLKEKFASKVDVGLANIAALRAGYNFADTTELFASTFTVPQAPIEEGLYRNVTGNLAAALGLVAGARKAGLDLFLGSYPITPASDLLHTLSGLRAHGVRTLQAEDEIAAICSAIGASFAGNLGVTTTSGPGLALKGEALGLALMTELPLVVIDVQRGGPSTGLPTKTEQSDLLMALYGRNGESPLPVLAASSPADCFETAFEAARITIKYRTPVLVLTDGYLGNGTEPWRIPDPDTLPDIDPGFHTDPEDFEPYSRDEQTLARPWAIPGTPGLEHRIGGLEKAHGSGNVSYDPANHQLMCELRRDKVEAIAAEIPPSEVHGAQGGELLVVSWGGTCGAVRTAVDQALEEGLEVGSVHLRFVSPLPPDLGDILRRYDKVLVPELNLGQLVKILRMEYLVDAKGLNKVAGLPFMVSEIHEAIVATLGKEA
jgi:2-oxoglutarate/2-oxoacid ferredoxin oxidoreductase subunit alpha